MQSRRVNKAINVRKSIPNKYIKNLCLKSLISNVYFNKNNNGYKIIWLDEISKFRTKANTSLARNFCMGTGIYNSHYRFCSGNRMWIKTMAEYGYLPGVRRSSW
jgi:ribosomal protein S14